MGGHHYRRGIAMALAMHQWADRKGGKPCGVDHLDRSEPGTLACRMDQWLEHLRTMAYSPSSVETARWSLRSFLVWAQTAQVSRPEHVSRALLEAWQGSLARGRFFSERWHA